MAHPSRCIYDNVISCEKCFSACLPSKTSSQPVLFVRHANQDLIELDFSWTQSSLLDPSKERIRLICFLCIRPRPDASKFSIMTIWLVWGRIWVRSGSGNFFTLKYSDLSALVRMSCIKSTPFEQWWIAKWWIAKSGHNTYADPDPIVNKKKKLLGIHPYNPWLASINTDDWQNFMCLAISTVGFLEEKKFITGMRGSEFGNSL